MTEAAKEKPTERCLYCNQLFELKRTDKKFCTEACKTAYHNDRRNIPPPPQVADPEQRYEQSTLAAIKRIQEIIFNNRAQLLNMYGLYENIVGLNDFYGFGINLKYFTSEYKDDDGYVYCMCYDYGYRISGEHVHLIYCGGEIHFN